MVLFFLTILTTTAPRERITPPPPHPGFEPIGEYWEGVPLEEMGLDLTPYCEPIQITEGPRNKRIPAIAIQGPPSTVDLTAHVIWSEPDGGVREIFEKVGPIDGSSFSEKLPVTEPDGHKSYNPVAISGGYYIYLDYMDESVNTREIWFRAYTGGRWTEPELVTDRDINSRSWGANPMVFFDDTSPYELPVMLWFDHRFTKHEILFKVRENVFASPNWGHDYPVKEPGWGRAIRVTEDDWFQFDPHADWSSAQDGFGFKENVIHLVYMDSRYGKQEDKHAQHEGNCEIFYRQIKPKGPLFNYQEEGCIPIPKAEWEIGHEVQLSFTPGLSDLPRVSGKRSTSAGDLNSAWVVWHELDDKAKDGTIICCHVEDSIRGDIYQINQPGSIAVNPEIISIAILGYDDLRAIVYQQYASRDDFPVGSSNIFMRLINNDVISEPIKVSYSDYTCSHPKVSRPEGLYNEFTLTGLNQGPMLPLDLPFYVAWSEYRAGRPDLAGESQIYFRSFLLSEIPQWPPESQTFRKQSFSSD
jgi:hypothetical protein